MRHRPAFKMRAITAAHNMILCIWSLVMSAIGIYGVFRVVKVTLSAW